MKRLPRITATDLVGAIWRRRWAGAMLLVTALAAGFAIAGYESRQNLRDRLFSTSPLTVADHPDLVRFAAQEAEPLYAAHCASCHGSDMEGNSAIGAPNLKDGHWIYGNGSVYEIERLILFGIRDGNARTRDVTEMPAFGQRGLLTQKQVQDIVQYMLYLNQRPHDVEAASEGNKIFYGAGAACFDCHSDDARGDNYYGAPDLTDNVWNWGGAPGDLYDSIFYGRHGIMPGWFGILDLEQIRALAVYIHTASTHKTGAKLAQSAMVAP
jgi:cytochrome c oxidase cbb3-type subunit III